MTFYFQRLLTLKNHIRANLTLSTALTLTRILLAPAIVVCILTAVWDAAACLFIFAALTDVLDGACARLFDEETVVGSYLDPFADKVLVLSCYGALIKACTSSIALPAWLLSFLIIKELVLIGTSVALVWTHEAPAVQPSWLGKSAMLLQTVSVFWFLLTLYAGHITLHINAFMHFLIFWFNACALGHYLYKGLRGTRLWYVLKKSLWLYSS